MLVQHDLDVMHFQIAVVTSQSPIIHVCMQLTAVLLTEYLDMSTGSDFQGSKLLHWFFFEGIALVAYICY